MQVASYYSSLFQEEEARRKTKRGQQQQSVSWVHYTGYGHVAVHCQLSREKKQEKVSEEFTRRGPPTSELCHWSEARSWVYFF